MKVFYYAHDKNMSCESNESNESNKSTSQIKYVLGKNAKENWDLLDKYKKENENYVWFHLNSFSSCYVIMCSNTNNEIINDASILKKYLEYGAMLCKDNSKYCNYNNLKIIYTTLNKLTKTDKIGEVIISGKKNIITI